jgi:hypothetical protein
VPAEALKPYLPTTFGHIGRMQFARPRKAHDAIRLTAHEAWLSAQIAVVVSGQGRTVREQKPHAACALRSKRQERDGISSESDYGVVVMSQERFGALQHMSRPHERAIPVPSRRLSSVR